jgi:putative transcriptional regulator
MITHHPSNEMLQAHVAGKLNASLSFAVSVHCEMCPCCQQAVEKITQQQSDNCFFNDDTATDYTCEFDAMLNAIMSNDEREAPRVAITSPRYVELDNKQIRLPRAISSLSQSKWQGLGKIARSRLTLDDDSWRMSLLYIRPDGEVPEHTHEGVEVTVLLDGTFSDHLGHYHKGDFIVLDQNHTHQPVTPEGCLCLAVVSDPLCFTKGLSKLLNPLGKLLY